MSFSLSIPFYVENEITTSKKTRDFSHEIRRIAQKWFLTGIKLFSFDTI